MGLEVELSYPEMLVAGNGGVLRQVNALRKRVNDPDAHHRDPMEAHVSGAISEWAVCKALGVPWDPVIGPKWFSRSIQPGDVRVGGHAIEIRSTSLENGCLIAHDYSFDDRAYVLVLTARAPVYELVGWMLGSDCKQQRFWRDKVPRPAYFIPQRELRPIEELLGTLTAAA